ncbi:terminase large subunit domain-containing protein [Jatrophihabitans sp. DSM 45814]
MGKPLMPWQRHVLDVALEIDPVTKLLVYRECRLTVPRQQGKTQLILILAIWRALGLGEPQNIVYTAQTRNDARQKWEKDHVEELRHSPFKSLFEIRLANGSEAIRWRNGSNHGITSSTEKAGHGSTIDLGIVDEAFAQIDYRTEQAMKPAMITREQPQLWVVSTAGTQESIYLNEKVEDGRARVLAGATDSVCYFEWSAPEDADPGDPQTWWDCMPALGHTITEDGVRAEYEAMKVKALREFKRAFLNQKADRPASPPPIDPELWAERGVDPDLVDVEDPVAFAVDVNPERSYAAIATFGMATSEEVDGRFEFGELVEYRPGIDWAVPRLAELKAEHNPKAIALDPSGPAGSLIPALQAAGIEPLLITAREMAQAFGSLKDATVAEDMFHSEGQPALDAAIAGAVIREFGDGPSKLARKGSAADICPLVALVAARQAWQTAEEPEEIAEFSVFFMDDLELCDECGKNPHEDPDGEHDFLCGQCREDTRK